MGHTDKTVPKVKQPTGAQGEVPVPKPKQGGRGTLQGETEEPKKKESQAEHQEQADGQGCISHCTKATEAECLERALFGAPKKQLQQMQGSIQEGSKLPLYSTGTHRGLGPFTALSGPQFDIPQGASMGQNRKEGRVPSTGGGWEGLPKEAHQGLQLRETSSKLHHFGSKLQMGVIDKEGVTQLLKVLAQGVKGGGNEKEKTEPVRTVQRATQQATIKDKQQAQSVGQLTLEEVEGKRQTQRANVEQETLQRIQQQVLQQAQAEVKQQAEARETHAVLKAAAEAAKVTRLEVAANAAEAAKEEATRAEAEKAMRKDIADPASRLEVAVEAAMQA